MADSSLRLAPGTGLLARRTSALLYSAAPDPALVEAFVAAPEGAELQALASATVAAGFAVGPFVGLSWDGQLRVMAFGDIAVETDRPSLPMLSGAGSRTWVEHTVAATGDAVVEVRGDDTDASTDLVAGTVPAGGFRLELGSVRAGAPAPTVEPTPVPGTIVDETTSIPVVEPTAVGPQPTPVVEQQVDPDDPIAALAAIQAAAVGADGQPLPQPGAASVQPPRRADPGPPEEAIDADVTLPPPASEALLADVRRGDAGDGRSSLVEAKLCAAGHANPPTAATCAVCADFLAPGAGAVVHVPRPSLGRLLLDDGDLVDLDQELLVGRSPDRDDDPTRAALRRVKTLGDKVSRSHLEVRFQEWDVLVTDRGSTNGTFVVPHPGGQVVALEPGRPQLIDPGAVVYFGSRSFTFIGREDDG